MALAEMVSESGEACPRQAARVSTQGPANLDEFCHPSHFFQTDIPSLVHPRRLAQLVEALGASLLIRSLESLPPEKLSKVLMQDESKLIHGRLAPQEIAYLRRYAG